MPYNDLREFLDQLEKTGDLVRVKEEVDWNLEAAAIIRRLNDMEGPAPLFERIKDYPDRRLCGDHLASFRRFAIGMGMNPEATYQELLDAYLDRSSRPVKPIVVNSGPCKEEIQVGDKVDLLSLPVPMVHGTDGGRYLGTMNVGMFKDPDSDWVNWGMYRLMLLDKNRCGILIIPTQHSGLIYKKYESRGQAMPYAACIGLDPTIHVGAAASLPAGASEAEVIGGVRGEPLRLVKCETSDLMVPAGAEIVLEGEILPNVREPEGPFGEYQGYSVHGKAPMPVFHVKAITTRKNPILTIVCEGMPVTMGHTVANVVIVAEMYKELIRQGLPVTGIYSPPWSCTDLLAISIKAHHGGLPQRVASSIWGTKSGMYFNKIMVTNDDVDVTNMDQLIHAFSTKCHPKRGIHILDGAWNIPLTPYLSPIERRTQQGANVLFDCTFPPEWPAADVPIKSDFTGIFPEEIQKKVLSRWKDYGFKN